MKINNQNLKNKEFLDCLKMKLKMKEKYKNKLVEDNKDNFYNVLLLIVYFEFEKFLKEGDLNILNILYFLNLILVEEILCFFDIFTFYSI